MNEIKDKLVVLRTGQGLGKDLKQSEVAEMTGINRTTISAHEHGRLVNTDDLARYAKLYNVSVDWLLGLSPVMRPSATGDVAKSLDVACVAASKHGAAIDLQALTNAMVTVRRYYTHGAPIGNAPIDMLNGYLSAFADFVTGVDDHDPAAVLDGANAITEQLLKVNAALHNYFAAK